MDASNGLPLQQFLALPPGSTELHLSVGTGSEGHEPLTALTGAVIDEWMGLVSYNHKDMEAKTRAAYLIGDIAWAFGLNLGAMHLAVGVPDIAAEALAAAPQWYRWEEDGESGEALRFGLRLLASPDAVHRPLEADGIRALAIAVHTPLIEALFVRTRLGRNAMWRLVADAVAAGWLAAGKKAGRADEAMREATAIVQAAGSPLANKQVGFIEIVVHDEAQQPLGCEWFRTRGGCCRYYTTAESEGEYCTTCVLRPTESRDQRLYDYLKGKLQVPA